MPAVHLRPPLLLLVLASLGPAAAASAGTTTTTTTTSSSSLVSRGAAAAAAGAASADANSIGRRRLSQGVVAAGPGLTKAEKHAEASLEGHPFKQHDHVPVLLNKVGPYNNPHETYRYLRLPYCKGKEGTDDEHSDMGMNLGQLFAGDRRVTSNYDITFKDNVQWRVLCTRKLNGEDVALFRKAVEEEYYFEMFVDGLPMWGFVGDFHDDFVWHRESKAHHYIYTHLKFDIAYNTDQRTGKEYIVAVNVTTDPKIRTDLHEGGVEVDFTYSVQWHASKVSVHDRERAYNRASFLPGQVQIHWLSVINSSVLVVLLVSFLAIILMKVLRSDIVRYMGIDDLEDDLDADGEEETGWKLIHGHVFRAPEPLVPFCAMLGVGAQFFCTIMLVLVLALLGAFSAMRRGGVATAVVLAYTGTSVVGGFVSGSFYRKLSRGEGSWVWTAVLTLLMFPVPFVIVFILVNSTAWANETTNALPFGTIMVMLSLFVLGSAPLSILGSICGRNMSGDFDAPCRVHKVPRQVPEVPFYRGALVHILIGGFLPFSAIYIEMHYIFEAMWGHKIYTLFGILFIAICLVVLVTAFITIALTYFQLAVEDHRWWWRSFASGGSIGLFIYAYCFYYYYNRTEMYGFQQTASFFGYMALGSFALFLALGFVGFMSSLLFVKFVYKSIRVD